MTKPVPKKMPSKATVTPIRQPHRGGRQSTGYDPETGEESRARGSSEEFQAFVLDGGQTGYRLDRFYTRSVDKNGHGEKLTIRVPQGIDSQMHRAVAEVAEYNTIHDLIRDAVMHRLEWLQKDYTPSPEIRRMCEVERLRADNHQENLAMMEMKAAVAELDEGLKLAWEVGDIQVFVNKLYHGSFWVDQMREPFDEEARKVLKKWREIGGKRAKEMQEEMFEDD